jgi:hypothetical protein
MKPKPNFLTMPVAEHLKPLQNEARLSQLRLLSAQRRFAATGRTTKDLEALEAREADADKTFDRYNAAVKLHLGIQPAI